MRSLFIVDNITVSHLRVLNAQYKVWLAGHVPYVINKCNNDNFNANYSVYPTSTTINSATALVDTVRDMCHGG